MIILAIAAVALVVTSSSAGAVREQLRFAQALSLNTRIPGKGVNLEYKVERESQVTVPVLITKQGTICESGEEAREIREKNEVEIKKEIGRNGEKITDIGEKITDIGEKIGKIEGKKERVRETGERMGGNGARGAFGRGSRGLRDTNKGRETSAGMQELKEKERKDEGAEEGEEEEDARTDEEKGSADKPEDKNGRDKETDQETGGEVTPKETTKAVSLPPSPLPPAQTPGPLALPLTRESKRRASTPTHQGLPKELRPIHPGGGSRFEDLERERLERAKMAQTKLQEEEDTEGAAGSAHDAEGLHSAAEEPEGVAAATVIGAALLVASGLTSPV